ncbi:Ig-like domain-containing protein [Leucobacter luti]|nr:Ig-like domain-containing protein [Leucobacter luti]
MRQILSVTATVLLALAATGFAATPATATAAAADDPCTEANGTVTCVFPYTAEAVSWVVPTDVTEVTAMASGAQGGSISYFTYGGLGGRTTAQLPVSPGESLTVVSGGAGMTVRDCSTPAAFGGFNGGGSATVSSGGCVGAGGGGASDVRVGGTALSDRVLVAGGGGGAANVVFRSSPASGGAGGGLTGGTGGPVAVPAPSEGSPAGTDPVPLGGTGGDQTGGGSGLLGVGGAGVPFEATTGNDYLSSGGGGGGGYYGGGGGKPVKAAGTEGSPDPTTVVGGGGGSGYGPAGAVFETGVRSGDGEVVISYELAATTLTVLPSALTVLPGEPVTLSARLTSSAPRAEFTGDVEFFAGATSLGAASVVGGTATLLPLELPLGAHQITASYAGSAGNRSAISTGVEVRVAKAETAVAVDVPAGPVTVGDEITLAATVTGVDPTGTVEFFAGSASLGTIALDSAAASGTARAADTRAARLTTDAIAAGTQEISARYSGDALNAAATSAGVALTVTPASVIPPDPEPNPDPEPEPEPDPAPGVPTPAPAPGAAPGAPAGATLARTGDADAARLAALGLLAGGSGLALLLARRRTRV